jgi:hypothetical protein
LRLAARLVFALSLTTGVASCADFSQVLTGPLRAPVSVDEVRVYTQPPAHFEQIAVLNASRRSVFEGTERTFQKMIETLKEQAGRLGANGLLLEDFSDSKDLSIAAGLGSQSYTHNGSIALGVGGSVGIFKKTAAGRAIFVPPG